jgi:hypothetical protein
MNPIIANQVSGVEALKLIQQGRQLQCPICLAVIKTVPESWVAGMTLYGIECPNDQRHFMIHCEDGDAMKEMRARMKKRTDSRNLK